jgi:hypothetical protein
MHINQLYYVYEDDDEQKYFFLTCIVWVFPLLVTPYAKIVPVIRNHKQNKQTIQEK